MTPDLSHHYGKRITSFSVPSENALPTDPLWCMELEDGAKVFQPNVTGATANPIFLAGYVLAKHEATDDGGAIVTVRGNEGQQRIFTLAAGYTVANREKPEAKA